MKRRKSTTSKPSSSAPWWAAVGVGTVLTLIPEPATTATGLTILATTFGAAAAKRAAE